MVILVQLKGFFTSLKGIKVFEKANSTPILG